MDYLMYRGFDLDKIIEYAEFRKRQLLGEPITGANNENEQNNKSDL